MQPDRFIKINYWSVTDTLTNEEFEINSATEPDIIRRLNELSSDTIHERQKCAMVLRKLDEVLLTIDKRITQLETQWENSKNDTTPRDSVFRSPMKETYEKEYLEEIRTLKWVLRLFSE